MGGKGSGGRRPGSGRKPKDSVLRGIDGGAAHRPAARIPTTNPGSGGGTAIAPVEEFDAPDDLTMEERSVWLKLAPHAFAARTLTKATALSFEMLCRNYALMRKMDASLAEAGSANHRGLIQRVDAELLRFNLSPCGKAMYEAQPEQQPANPVNRFLKGGRR